MIECGCACEVNDAESPCFYEETHPVARKEHVCEECLETIQRGERYQRISGKWPDGFMTIATCLTCERIRRDVCATLGDLDATVWECYGVNLR